MISTIIAYDYKCIFNRLQTSLSSTLCFGLKSPRLIIPMICKPGTSDYPYHVINATLASALPIQDFKTGCVFISPLQLWAVHVARHEVRFGLSNAFKDRGLLVLQEAQNRRNLVKIGHPANSLEFHFLL